LDRGTGNRAADVRAIGSRALRTLPSRDLVGLLTAYELDLVADRDVDFAASNIRGPS